MKLKTTKLFIYTILLFAIFMSIVSFNVISASLSLKDTNFKRYVNGHSEYKFYEIDDKRFQKIDAHEKVFINEMCSNGCNLKVEKYNSTYYYMITHNNEGYKLNMIKNNQVILNSKSLGYYLDKAYFVEYLDYVVFFNEIDDGVRSYDYANVFDESTHVDEFTSLSSEELEFTSDGIIYYYDACEEEPGKIIKAIRRPFSAKTKIIDAFIGELDWC